MIIVYAFQIMGAMDQEEKIKKGKTGVLHVILALLAVKVIDYIFYIAQAPNFTHQATDFIIQIAKLMGYLLGAAFVIFTFYAGFLLLTSGGDEESMKKVKNILVTIILSSIVIALFLLIAYQLFSEFA
ncbi:MAG: hypothetical protein GXP45_07850 [bacterium]|nr:hypothetical protein [bacterium]